MRPHFFCSRVLFFLLGAGACSWLGTVAAAEKTATELLPGSIVGYLEVPQPGKILDVVLDHPLAKEIEQQPEYQQALETPQYQQLQAATKLVEDRLGMK